MRVGKICKATSIVLFILNFIGSIVLGNTFAIPKDYSFGDPSFNLTIFLYSVIMGFIFCLLLYALGEIIDQLEYLNSNSKKIFDSLKAINIVIPDNTLNNQTAETTRESQKSEHMWVCNSCGKLRDKSPCPNCGNK